MLPTFGLLVFMGYTFISLRNPKSNAAVLVFLNPPVQVALIKEYAPVRSHGWNFPAVGQVLD
jgi:hypothetical protein